MVFKSTFYLLIFKLQFPKRNSEGGSRSSKASCEGWSPDTYHGLLCCSYSAREVITIAASVMEGG